MRNVISSVSMCLVLAVPALAMGQKKDAGKPSPEQMQAMMAAWQKHATPGEAHKKLAKSVGKWNAVVKMQMGPGAPPMQSKGTADFAPMFGGRFVRQTFTGSFMGQTFQGEGLMGYDNFKKQYFSTWCDNMSTSIMLSWSTAEDAKTVTYVGDMDEPMTGERGKKVKSATRWVDDNTMVYESWDKAGGQEWKALEITYTRAK